MLSASLNETFRSFSLHICEMSADVGDYNTGIVCYSDESRFHLMNADDWLQVWCRHEEGRKEMFYLTTHSTHFIYGYMASDIW